MNILIQNSETGEIETPYQFDENTPKCYDEETGEPTINKPIKFGRHRKQHFHVPQEYLKLKRKRYRKSLKRTVLGYCRETYTLTNKKKVINLKEEIILGCNKTSHRLFLIFFLTKITALLFICAEIFLHVWAHRKNSKNTNPNIYYRSPMHILTSQFCAKCRSQTECDNINKIHRSWQFYKNLHKISLA